MTLENANDKVQEICEKIRTGALGPAQEEAKKIVEEARATAAQIVHEAKEEAGRIETELKEELEKKRKVFDSTIELAVKQALARLRESALGLFSETLQADLEGALQTPDVIAKLIDAIVLGIKKDGANCNLAAYISKAVSVDEVVEHLTKQVYEAIGKGSIQLSNLPSGVSISVIDKKLTLEVTDESIRELLQDYLPDALRQKVFT